MTLDDRDINDRHYWARQMPKYPCSSHFGGAPLALEPEKAGKILVDIAYGMQPRAAFALEGISARTYQRYLQRAQTINSGAPDALPEKGDQTQIDRYLFVYFELQQMALEIAGIQRTKAELQLMQGSPTQRVTRKRTTKHRQIWWQGQRVNLCDTTEVQSYSSNEHQPKVPPTFVRNEEF
jgi:hypothetical protein